VKRSLCGLILCCVTALSPLEAENVSTSDKVPAAVEAAKLAAKHSWHSRLDKLVGKAPKPLVSIYNAHTREFVAIDAKRPQELTQSKVDAFFRCHFTNQPTGMDKKLFPVLVAAASHFEVDRINIISGYRSPKYNLILIKKGREVARRSQHVLGRAIDFRLPGVPTQRLQQWVKGQGLGGVGYYPRSRFVHMDTWRVRYWTAN
jgi:uncharacterized protein YcbK (DUF882 family)